MFALGLCDYMFLSFVFAGLLVTKGAAYWGLFPSGFVNSRVMRFTYAYRLSQVFNDKIHDPKKVRMLTPILMSANVETPRVYACRCIFVCNCTVQPTTQNDDGEKYSCNVLVPLVQKGDSQLVEKPVTQTLYPIKKTDATVGVTFFRVDRTIPTGLGTRATCTYIAYIYINIYSHHAYTHHADLMHTNFVIMTIQSQCKIYSCSR